MTMSIIVFCILFYPSSNFVGCSRVLLDFYQAVAYFVTHRKLQECRFRTVAILVTDSV